MSRSDTTLLVFELELQSLSGLLTVLTTVARLGGNLTCLEAAQCQARLGVDMPLQVAHRLEGLLGQIVEVLRVRSLQATCPPSSIQ
jgi:hypothetical protein